jgi:hypothetical protein
MAYGIEVRNSSGFIQFSTETAACYRRFASGSITVGASSDEDPTSGTVNVSGVSNKDDVIVAIRPTSGDQGFARMGSTAGQIVFYNTDDAASTTYAWVMFKKAPLTTVPTSGYGVNVLDSSSKLIFSSVGAAPAIEAVVTIDFTSYPHASYTYTTGYGKPWILVTSGVGVPLVGLEDWEEGEEGDGTGEGTYEIGTIVWGTTTVSIQPTGYTVVGVTEPDFYNNYVGVTYNTAKLVVLTGYGI